MVLFLLPTLFKSNQSLVRQFSLFYSSCPVLSSVFLLHSGSPLQGTLIIPTGISSRFCTSGDDYREFAISHLKTVFQKNNKSEIKQKQTGNKGKILGTRDSSLHKSIPNTNNIIVKLYPFTQCFKFVSSLINSTLK